MVLSIKVDWFIWLAIVWLLSACSSVTVEPRTTYSQHSRAQFYQLDRWSFDGRLAITAQNDSWSANLSWDHTPSLEEMKLSGPLGQGAAVIRLSDGFVSIDRGNGQVETSVEPEDFVNEQLGIFVPVMSLRYWVLGLPEPTQTYAETLDGFTQAGWLVTYNQMQAGFNSSMPRKITVVNSRVTLKLIIDQWFLNDARSN
jgi:outer membrane lipoprotein LolB